MFCIDASVILSAIHGTERYSKQSRMFLDKIRKDGIKVFFPSIVLTEVASGLMRATKNPRAVLDLIFAMKSISNFSFISIDERLSLLAAEVIARTSLRSADAIYVATALDHNLELVTLDKEQLSKSKEFVPVRMP